MRGQALTAEDREEISRGISEGFSGSAIARLLTRDAAE
ncbi:helix-turn-helix domain-containing protein [Frankia sp. Cas3]